MLVSVLVLLVSLIALSIGAELLIRGSVAIARAAGLPSFFIGLTIVGFGTSTPELATAAIAALNDQSDLAVGNCVGSNIFNIAVILGCTALVCPIPVRIAAVRREVVVVMLVALVPLTAVVSGGVLTRVHAGLMLAGLGAFLWAGYLAGRSAPAEESAAMEAELERELALGRKGGGALALTGQALLAVVGLALLVVGSRFFVESASGIARGLGVSELVIGLTIVAGGTSAPELVTSIVAALRKQPDIAVGNILGSNVFNIFGILGIASLVRPQGVASQAMLLDTPMMLAASVALLPVMFSGGRISRLEGAAMLAAYAGYVAVLFLLAPGWFGAS